MLNRCYLIHIKTKTLCYSAGMDKYIGFDIITYICCKKPPQNHGQFYRILNLYCELAIAKNTIKQKKNTFSGINYGIIADKTLVFYPN